MKISKNYEELVKNHPGGKVSPWTYPHKKVFRGALDSFFSMLSFFLGGNYDLWNQTFIYEIKPLAIREFDAKDPYFLLENNKKLYFRNKKGLFIDNLNELSKEGFREATTSEVIGYLSSIRCCILSGDEKISEKYTIMAGYRVKGDICMGYVPFDISITSDCRMYHLGRIVKTSKGIFFNPPKDNERNTIICQNTLESLLNKCVEHEGCFFGENDFVFVPYDRMDTTDSKEEFGTKYPKGSTRGSRTWNFYSTGLMRGLECRIEGYSRNLYRIMKLTNKDCNPQNYFMFEDFLVPVDKPQEYLVKLKQYFLNDEEKEDYNYNPFNLFLKFSLEDPKKSFGRTYGIKLE